MSDQIINFQPGKLSAKAGNELNEDSNLVGSLTALELLKQMVEAIESGKAPDYAAVIILQGKPEGMLASSAITTNLRPTVAVNLMATSIVRMGGSLADNLPEESK